MEHARTLSDGIEKSILRDVSVRIEWRGAIGDLLEAIDLEGYDCDYVETSTNVFDVWNSDDEGDSWRLLVVLIDDIRDCELLSI